MKKFFSRIGVFIKKLLARIYLPLLQVDNNIYSFLSGIFISLATNIFTTLCFEKYDWIEQWHYYLSTVMFLIASALCLYLATKLNGIQNYINNNPRMQGKDRKKCLLDAANENQVRWFFAFSGLFASVIFGVWFLAYSYLSNLSPVVQISNNL